MSITKPRARWSAVAAGRMKVTVTLTVRILNTTVEQSKSRAIKPV